MNLFLLRAPTDLDAFRDHAAAQAPNFAPIPPERVPEPPPGYQRDHNRVLLGRGQGAWDRARAAFDAWHMFDLPWIRAWPDRPTPEAGGIVIVVARQFPIFSFGLWVRNAARIAWVDDTADAPIARYGFCYLTLPSHVEQGAERFQIQWDRRSNEVHYDLLAISRPAHPLARLSYPWVRRQQARFARGSLDGMRRAVSA